MCGLCGVLGSEHWGEAGGRRSRLVRVALLDRVLATSGLDLHEWAGHYVVRDRKGRSLVVDDRPGVWAAAEQLGGVALDPLSPLVVRAIESS
jgi:hypothetical protein